ncbi:MAG: tetratricopeptide repeat protein [Deltaproteobacteria bacterium]|nr:tetratricopeptide repeat protein [Deltaproteobacteria bacterium]
MSTRREGAEETRTPLSPELERVRQAVEQSSAPLDDLGRARIHAKLDAALDRLETKARAPGRRDFARWPWVAAGVAAALLLAGLVGLLLRRGASPVRRDAVPAVAQGNDAQRARGLRPYLWAGSAASWAVGEPRPLSASDRLVVPAGGLVRARLEGRGWVTLVGPGTLALRRPEGATLELELSAGLLLLEVTRRPAERVRVVGGGLRAEVVGTRFAVDLRGRAAAVAVARGAVQVTSARERTLLRAGERVSRGTPGPRPLDAELAALLAEHGRAGPPPTEELGTLALTGTPADGRVRVGGVVLGPSPLVAELPAGTAELSVEADGHAATALTVELERGRVTRLGYALTRLAQRDGGGAADAEPRRQTGQRARGRTAMERRGTADGGASGRLDAATRETPPRGAVDAAPPRPSAAALYAQGEAALRRGDRARGEALLASVVKDFPEHRLAAAALLELARLARERGQSASARRYLGELLARRDAVLWRESAHLQLCRLEVEARRRPEAERCLTDFRGRYPRSPHDEDALLALARLAEARGGCPAARPWFEEYLRRYPTGRFAAEVARRLGGCR